MTVSELIEKLKEMDPTLPAVTYAGGMFGDMAWAAPRLERVIFSGDEPYYIDTLGNRPEGQPAVIL